MSRKCSICGSEGADILCGKCRTFVCEDCFDADADACVKCAGKTWSHGKASSPKLLVGGLGLIVLGLVLTSWALTGSSDSTIVFFPFVFTNMSSSAAFIISMVFFALFTVSSLLPVYLMLRRGSYSSWDEGIYTLRDSYMGGNVSETIEFMITTEIPKEVE
ncbi:hypothetical protein JXL21_02060, partial [Candidatus Bathyarchaeota archaeon]|nr:hypothetical protein [Candidatus Bathyarchaeota archaeon]